MNAPCRENIMDGGKDSGRFQLGKAVHLAFSKLTMIMDELFYIKQNIAWKIAEIELMLAGKIK